MRRTLADGWSHRSTCGMATGAASLRFPRTPTPVYVRVLDEASTKMASAAREPRRSRAALREYRSTYQPNEWSSSQKCGPLFAERSTWSWFASRV